MTYAIGNIIYGTPITNANFFDKLRALPISELPKELGKNSFTSEADWEWVCELLEDGEIDECTHVRLADIRLGPTLEEKVDLKKYWDALPKPIRDLIPALEVYIVWSTS